MSTATAGGGRRGARRGARLAGVPLALVLVAAVGLLLLVMQAVSARDLLNPATFASARGADRTIAVNGVLAALTVVLAVTLPRRLAWLAIAPGAVLAASLLGGVAILGGHLWDIGVAILTAACVWQLGRWIVRAVAGPRLAEMALVDVVVGIGALGLLITALGRVGLLRWWSIGLLTVAVGAFGLWEAGRAIAPRRAAIAEAVAVNRLGAACAGLLAIQLGWAAIWIGAPEIMYDAVYAKAWLPEIWAHSGSIAPLIAHPVLNTVGFAQLVAVPGHVLGGPDVGRWLELLAWLAVIVAIWSWGRRVGPYGPLAAVVVGISPHLVWQSTTADDDLILGLAALGLAIAAIESVHVAEDESPARVGLVLGVLAGTCLSLKIHLAPLAFLLLGGWIVLGRADGNAARRLLGATVGAFVAGAPALIVRWIEVGNPVFPAYNNIFRSPYWPPINDRLNFPYWHDPGLRGALTWMWEAVRNPSPMIEVTPPGGFGLLIGALFVGFAIGWRRSASRAAPLVWLALVLATTLWWVQFRYLRYLVPSFLVATALVLLQAGGRQLGRGATIVLATAAAALLALSLPATIATFWNVPQRKLPVAAAFGRWDARDYRRHVDTSVDALDAFQRAAPRGAKAMVSPEGALRVYADDRDLSPTWEVFFRLQADGPLPTGADEALRRMRAKGIGWVLMSDAELPRLGATYVPSLLAVHGEVVFADRGWTVYHLVDRPRVPPSLPPCDPRLVGRPACWVGMKPLDRHPGISGAEAPGGVFRTLAICGGQTVVVRPELAASGTPAQVTLDFDGRDPLLGLVNGGVAPGTATPVTGTAPRDAHHVAIRIIPGAGSLVRTIGVAVAGGCAD